MSAPFLFEPEPSASQGPVADPATIPSGPSATEPRSLYRKYRPQTFGGDDLVGQEPIVRTLRNAIRLDRAAHAYLFCGPRGTGKTTTARLLAKAVNCLDPDPDRRPCNRCASCRAIAGGAATDVVEIDAASNRGIDDIRDLRERVKYAPTLLRVKFYIVDEAHQITGPAANAFLKTLEEPPAHTKFVLATTDPEELLPTIVSRCQRFDFRRIGTEATVARLRTVAAAEGLPVSEEALATIARHATGSLRDALGLLDQLALYREDDGEGHGEITADAVRAVLGVSRNDRVESLTEALADRDATAALGTVNAAVEAGEDPRQLNRQLVAYLRLLLHQRAGGSPDADGRACALAARFELAELAELARRFGEIDYKIKHSAYGQLPLEVALVESVLRGGRAVVAAPAEATVVRTVSPAPAASSPVGADERALAEPTPPMFEAPLPADPPTMSLRDRVRGIEGPRPQASVAARPPERPAPGPAAANGQTAGGASSGANGGVDVERLVDLWPRVRQDVKAVNRRIEALLSSIDPVAVTGEHITLAAAYEFHRDKLNSDEVRAVVEETIARLVGAPVRVRCLLRSEMGPPSAPPSTAESPAPAPSAPSAPPDVPAQAPRAVEDDGGPAYSAGPTLEADEQRLQAAKNIFDAEEIEVRS
ncbi:MAG: DNA polymerase III subunit gamma/tau [Chloroflexota bacterium]|nr:DNA polymerase III subunit gamma/tau [Chloroflexota bacterium]